ncbi:MAG: hypothetical protein V1902_03500 [Candidatus Falkowbacteria bacterium]
MDKKAFKVAVSCFIGAGIGALVALEMNQWFWWVGLLVGGFVGYLSYEWRTVLHAIPAAFKAAERAVFNRPKYFWTAIGLSIIGIVEYSAIFGSLMGFIAPNTSTYISVWICTTCLFAIIFSFTYFHDEMQNELRKLLVAGHLRRTVTIVILPIGISWLLWRFIINTPRMVCAIGRGIVLIAKFIKRFGWEMFIRIHSEIRLLCGIDAMIGAAIGFFSGSVLIGAFAGAAFGALNYAVITVRWLIPAGHIQRTT